MREVLSRRQRALPDQSIPKRAEGRNPWREAPDVQQRPYFRMLSSAMTVR